MSLPLVSDVVPDSPAAKAGLVIGDELTAISGVVPSDVIEYQQLVDDARISLGIRRGGREWEVEIVKRPGESLGVRLDRSVFDRVQTCDNHCEFCFIYQLPPGMRRTLYLKDDDYRLSFLYGNFTTLTRFTELDLARVTEERLSPLYVSIHATEPAVRERMLRNRRGATSLRWLRALLAAGIQVHGQIVLCPGVNDGEVLDRTCAEVLVRYRELKSVGVVPIGLSRFNREPGLRVHTGQEAKAAIAAIEAWQRIALRSIGRRMFFASDELYLQAASPLPSSLAYEGFPQHENGIGMARGFYDELEHWEAGASVPSQPRGGMWLSQPAAPAEGYRAQPAESPFTPNPGPLVLVTAEYGARVLNPVLERLANLSGRPLRLLSVGNRFFGGNVAVAGLMVGEDVANAIASDSDPAGGYLIPNLALSGDRFLDDFTLAQVQAASAVPVLAVPPTVAGIVHASRS